MSNDEKISPYMYLDGLKPIFEFKSGDDLIAIYADGRILGTGETEVVTNKIKPVFDWLLARAEEELMAARGAA